MCGTKISIDPIMSIPNIFQSLTPRLVVEGQSVLGEGAIWDYLRNQLYWVDIEGCKLHIYNPESSVNKTISLDERIGTVVFNKEGRLLLALENGIQTFDPGTEDKAMFAHAITSSNIRYNDGKCDPAGRFWVGSMHLEEKPGAASLYRIDTDGKVTTMLENLTISNGIVWSSDTGKMYFIDTPTNEVAVFDFNMETGTISNKRTAISIPKDMGSPDGMTIDEDGNLWIALYGGSAVGCWNPESGQLLTRVEMPVPNVTSCAFGDEALDALYITTASQKMSEEELARYPLSGGLFKVKPGVRGVKAALGGF